MIMGGSTGGTGDQSPANFSVLNIIPMGGAWKESTSNGPRPPPQSPRRGAALARDSFDALLHYAEFGVRFR